MARGRPLLAVAVLLLTACSPTPSPTPAPAPSISPRAVAAALASAQDLVFANHYDQAERIFGTLVAEAPKDADAHADHALLLNYRHDFGDALTEARAAVALGPRDGRAQAILTRVLDWSTKVTDAVIAGRRATALAPSDPLAHLFLSEALADSGDIATSRAEIGRAQAALGPRSTAYERAELHREEGNLAHDLADPTGELASDQAAYDLQPGWVERSTELAAAFIDDNQLDGAHRTLTHALTLAPDDAALLTSLGQVAILEPDFAAAEQAYARLVALAPRDPVALESDAEVVMAVHHDSKTARALLLRALTADPRDGNAVAYILYLARAVDGDVAAAQEQISDAVATALGADSAHPRPVTVPDPDADRAAHAATALAALNQDRATSGLGPVVLDSRLSRSATAHCFYWLVNNALPAIANLGIHQEVPGTIGFTGVRAGDRADTAGWHGGPIGEDITHRGTPDAAVADWLDSVYHRFPMVRPDLRSIGYADCALGPLPMEDMEFGFAAVPDRPPVAPVLVPGDGQHGVPTTFIDNELPDPLPAGAQRTAGEPVTVTFDVATLVRLTAFSLHDAAGAEVPVYELSPSSATENSATLLPRTPLASGATYTAHVSALIDGRPYDRTWTFVTG